MTLKMDSEESTLYVYLEGELDHHSARDIREEIDNSLARHRPKKLILDFAQVTFMDSSGIGLVMGRFRNMSPYGGEIHIRNTSPRVTRVMRLSGFEKLGIKFEQQDTSKK